MPIPVVCQGCAKTLNAPDHAAGRKVRCPGCGEAVPVPVEATEPAEEALGNRPRPRPPSLVPASRGKPAAPPADDPDDEPQPARRPATRKRADDEDWDDEEEDRRPARRRRKKGKSRRGIPGWVWVVVGIAAVVVIAISATLAVVVAGGFGTGSPYDQVRRGMTEAEVTRLLGPPTMSMDLDGFGNLFGDNPLANAARGTKVMVWANDRESLSVTFRDGKVEATEHVRDTGGGDPFQRNQSAGGRRR
jgi:hypothetical protein